MLNQTHRKYHLTLLILTLSYILTLTSAAALYGADTDLPVASLFFHHMSDTDRIFTSTTDVYVADDNNQKIGLLFIILPHPKTPALGAYFIHEKICRDNSSRLLVEFANAKIIELASVSSPDDDENSCGELTLFLINAAQFPTQNITGLRVDYKLGGKVKRSQMIKQRMFDDLSYFIQTSIHEGHLILKEHMVGNPKFLSNFTGSE